MVLEQGEKYLSISIKLGEAQQKIFEAIKEGKDKVDFAAFINKNREQNSQQPHYRGVNGLAVWENKKKGIEQTQEEVI